MVNKIVKLNQNFFILNYFRIHKSNINFILLGMAYTPETPKLSLKIYSVENI
jgi:hypothetical protein